MFLLLRDL